MEIYETQEMSHNKLKIFLNWFDEEIGTDREINQVDDDTYYVVCVELEPSEIKQIRQWENDNT